MSWALSMAQKSTLFAPNALMLQLKEKGEQLKWRPGKRQGLCWKWGERGRQGPEGTCVVHSREHAGARRQPVIFLILVWKKNEELFLGL